MASEGSQKHDPASSTILTLRMPTILVEENIYQAQKTEHRPIQMSQLAIPSDATQGEATLDEVLREHAFTHADGEHFWSEQRLREILSEGRITAHLQQCGENAMTTPRTIHEIKCNCLRLYAVLALVGKESEFWELIRAGLTDQSLPLQCFNRAKSSLALASSPTRALMCFDKWRSCERDMFAQWQFRVTPAYLDLENDRRTIKHMNYGPRDVLPFLTDGFVQAGGYGSIYKVTIHSQCHGFRDVLKTIITDEVFALKRIKQSTDQPSKEELEFRREVQALKRFSGFVHDHLVTLLMTWNIRGEYCLLFPWAGLDLDNYWRTHPSPISGVNPDIPTIRWLSKQILGLAGALNTIHNPRQDGKHLVPGKKYGRHGDIKPENILWYRSPTDERGILVLADLGLTTFNATKSRSNIPGQSIPFSPDYRPPECDLLGGVVSRAFDIWTFGCLLLELCCWALGGQENRDHFDAFRKTPYITGYDSNIYFDIETNKDRTGYVCGVKRQVSKWIADLHSRPACTQFFHDLLDLIETGMIVMMSKEKERIRSTALLGHLTQMYDKVTNPTDAFCQYICPRQTIPRDYAPVSALLNQHAIGLIKTRKPDLQTYGGRTQTPKTPEELEAMKDKEDTGLP